MTTQHPSAIAPPPEGVQAQVSAISADETSGSSGIHELLNNLTPRAGQLKPLRTKAEAESGLELVDAHIVCVKAQNANKALKLIDAALPHQAVSHLQHLRRVAKPDFLPRAFRIHVEERRKSIASLSSGSSSSSSLASTKSGAETAAKLPNLGPRRLYVVAAPTSLISVADLNAALGTMKHHNYIVQIPNSPPPSQDEAQLWSQSYWSCVYRSHNPFGPQPVIITKAESAIQAKAGLWLALADKAAQESHLAGLGEQFGAVIVDPNAGGDGPHPVVAAGDTRWQGCKGDLIQHKAGNGNPACHAAMRAIGLLARQRVVITTNRPNATNAFKELDDNIFLDQPLTQVEEFVNKHTILKAGGYLCAGLEIWLTHEPCVMCSMAILHSRFERMVIGKRMPATGAMVGEKPPVPDLRELSISEQNVPAKGSQAKRSQNPQNGGLGYGLFWRPELNWKMLAWEWIENNDGKDSTTTPTSGASPEKIHV